MRIRKRTCHITVIVSRYTPEQLTRLRTADTQSGRVRTSSGAADARRRRVERSRALETQRRVAEEAAEHDHDHEGHDHDHEGHDHEGHDHDVDDAVDLDETGPYGPGSAEPLEDGSAPEGYDIKGNEDSMLYHVPGSRYYGATVAEVYFATVEDAESAGFAAPGSASEGDTDGDDAEEGAE
jgi:hypothetical protein